MHKKILFAFSSTIVMAVLVILAIDAPRVAVAGSGQNVSGFGWSSNIGWISFNNTTSGDSTNYGVNIDQTTGAFSGYAWSPSVGWISFTSSDLSGCPTAPCASVLNWTTGAVSGWARALTAKNNPGPSGGWDGWINLSGVKLTTSTNQFTGYAWGADVIGFMDLSGVTVAAAPIPTPSSVSASASVTAICPAKNTVTVSWGAVPGATGYSIKRDSTTLAPPPTVTGSPYTDTPPPGSYTYSVAAITALGTSAYAGAAPVTVPACIVAQCNDGTDNDSDTWNNYPDDPGCSSSSDNDESDDPQCSDGSDNDGDLKNDNLDPGCLDSTGTYDKYDNDEKEYACGDNLDNDNDGLADYLGLDANGDGDLSDAGDKQKDPGCSSATDNNEFNLKSITPR